METTRAKSGPDLILSLALRSNSDSGAAFSTSGSEDIRVRSVALRSSFDRNLRSVKAPGLRTAIWCICTSEQAIYLHIWRCSKSESPGVVSNALYTVYKICYWFLSSSVMSVKTVVWEFAAVLRTDASTMERTIAVGSCRYCINRDSMNDLSYLGICWYTQTIHWASYIVCNVSSKIGSKVWDITYWIPVKPLKAILGVYWPPVPRCSFMWGTSENETTKMAGVFLKKLESRGEAG